MKTLVQHSSLSVRDLIHVTDAALLADNKIKWLNAFESHAFPISLEARTVEGMVLLTEAPVKFESWAWETVCDQKWIFTAVGEKLIEITPYWCIQRHSDARYLSVNCLIFFLIAGSRLDDFVNLHIALICTIQQKVKGPLDK